MDVVVRDGQQHMDGRGLREESVRRKAEHEGRAVGCGGELIVAVAVPCGRRRDFFQPLEREGEAGKLLKLDLVRLDAQHGGSLRLGDVVSEAPLGQKNACDGEFIGDSLTQNGVELPDVEERLFRVDIDPGEGRRLDGVVFVELVERELQLSGRILAADTAAGSVHPIEDVQQRRLIRAVGRYLIPEGEGCTGLQSRDFAVQLEKDHTHSDHYGHQHDR